MNYLLVSLLFILSYLLGSFPTGYILTKRIKNIDIREHGSNSTGATNTTRVLGLKYGLITILGDCLKGIIIMAILIIFKLEQLYLFDNGKINILPLYGFFAVIGHIYPIYLNFKGGKAVATSFGIVLFLSPLMALIGALVFILIVIFTKYVSLGSILGAISIFISTMIFSVFDIKTIVLGTNNNIIPIEYPIIIGLLTLIIIVRHRENIKRLIHNNENKISFKK